MRRRILGLILTFCLLSPSSFAVDMTTNLVSYWKQDEASGNALDAHGANTLTDNNSVGTATGKINGGRDFEVGSTHFFSHADTASLDVGNYDFTFQAWVKLESKAANMAIFAKYGSGAEYIMFYDQAADRFVFRIYNEGEDTAYDAVANNLGSPSTGTWYLIHGWHDEANDLVGIAVNAGTADTTGTLGNFPNAGNADPFYIGILNGAVWGFDGVIDEAALWTHRLLSSQDRTDLYNGGNGLAYPSANRTCRLTLLGVGC